MRAAPKAASPAAKAASLAPKPPVEAVKQASVAAKPAFKPMPKKMAGSPREAAPPANAKTAAANGKSVVKKSKKGVR